MSKLVAPLVYGRVFSVAATNKNPALHSINLFLQRTKTA